ncbi:uncharacterized protein TOT_010000980 [Theileria orientalis strain Shintoku]|uniref:RAP domain-containing protein n=1 Tax=Theileria orientalis strain Shintoku TaxID=869250 RepID=J4D6E3_THEOR|nr:uncharacterized protein TOT_010000980 [Theileria orientalis strain Shintoku]BAM39525.1 uncharacterized protein TOT_010000980 [Theileria orientalis strain Shintoku]|eukprot:XP_009689826.1 uncharacterized protein TOT_010000980 [Theileria orientalis strain Shintoku]
MIPSILAAKSKLVPLGSDIAGCVCVKMMPSLIRHQQHRINLVSQNKPAPYLYRPVKYYNAVGYCGSGLDVRKGPDSSHQNHTDAPDRSSVLKRELDIGSFYLENLFSIDAEEWYRLLTDADDRTTILCLLTNFQRHIRHLKCRELLYVMEKCCKYGIRDNNELIDVYYVLLCEVLYNFLNRNDRTLSLSEISRLCKIMSKVKFNREFDCRSTVPICSCNFELDKNPAVCKKCKVRYRELLNLNGVDLVTILTVELGKSILKQSKELRRKNDNALVPYLVMVGSKNCTLVSHIVRRMCVEYQPQFISTKSIRNTSILLHTIKRTKSRANPLAKRIFERLSGDGVIESLLDRELSTSAKLVAISQIIQFCINTHYSGSKFNRNLDTVVARSVEYARNLCESGAIELQQYPNFISQLNLLNRSAELERHGLKRLFTQMGLREFLTGLEQVRPVFSQIDHNTSNTHVQVDSVLKSFNYETLLEHFISPYLVDIFVPSKNAIIEVDGPYHYATGMNERVNAIMKRPLGRFPCQYSLNSRLKRRLLSKSGYKFFNIPYQEWPQSTNEQIYYISSLKI